MLNVVFASSDVYSSFLLTALISLVENNQNDFQCINIFILDNGINMSSKNKISDLSKKYPCKITFIDLARFFDSLTFDLPLVELKSSSDVTSLTTYSRLFVSTLLPDDIDRILFLDCDAIVLDSFKDLWDTNIDDYYCAGVLDPLIDEHMKSQFWFLNVESYINAGFLFVNLKKWRENNVEEKFIKFINNNCDKYFVADQGVINLVLKDKIKIIEPKYNLLFGFQSYDYDVAKMLLGMENEYYTKEIVDDSKKNPVFVHFPSYGSIVPWNNTNHKYYLVFKKYAKMVGCEELIQPMNLSFKAKIFRYDNKLGMFFLKLIPSKLISDRVNKAKISSWKNLESKNIKK